MNLVTFIVPTLGRPELGRALNSIIAQTNPDWNAVVIADGLKDFAAPVEHPRIFTFGLQANPKSWQFGGPVRNIGFAFDAAQWFAFLDDDDRLDEHYVEWIKEEGGAVDVVVFRMKFPDGNIVPPMSTTTPDQLQLGATGISFAIRATFQKSQNLQFTAEYGEDWAFIKNCRDAGARIKVSERVGYYIRQ
jgi:glycosyltransferase involved in cell wall biosynthesis